MNICKVLDLSPGFELTSMGTVHFPEEKRVMEFFIKVEDSRWRSMRYGSCIAAPDGGFKEIQESHQDLMGAWAEDGLKMKMICRENVSEEEVVKLILGELQKAGFPHSLEKEAAALGKRLEICGRKLRPG